MTATARLIRHDDVGVIELDNPPSSALGGGLEMANACHDRMAAAGTQLGLPEVRRGLLPGGGGTQRLPRLMGMATALRMIVTGDTVDADGAKAIGLIDELAAGDGVDAYFAAERTRVRAESRGLEAPLEYLACVEAATRLSFDQGLTFERARFHVLLKSRVVSPRRCATCSSPSAPPRASPASPTISRRARCVPSA